MEFRYHYIIQDLVGILFAFIYFRLVILNIKLMYRRSINVKICRLCVYHLLYFVAGVTLFLGKCSLKTWAIFIIILISGSLIKPKYTNKGDSHEDKLSA